MNIMRNFLAICLCFIGIAFCSEAVLYGCDLASDFSEELAPETLKNVARVLRMETYDPQKVPADIRKALHSEVNSPKAFGQRMRSRLEELLTYPDSFTPSYENRYKSMIYHADSLTPHQAYAYNMLLGEDSSKYYKEVPPTVTFDFREDDRPQFEYPCGWHFFVGSVWDTDGQEYGVQLMFWQVALLPPTMMQASGLTTIQNQMVEIHFAISRVGDRHYRSEPYVIAGTTGLIHFNARKYEYVVGKNIIASQAPAGSQSLFPLRLSAWGLDESGQPPVPFAIDLVLEQNKSYLLNGDKGLAPSCGGVGTLYYSVPRLTIDADQSTLSLDGKTVDLAKGLMWYDHQYGTGFMPGGNPRSELIRAFSRTRPQSPGGWEWIPVQFKDDTELALTAMHNSANAQQGFYNNTGPNMPGVMTAKIKGNYVPPSGKGEKIIPVPVNGTMKVLEWVQSQVAYGEYQRTNVWFPNLVEVSVNKTNATNPVVFDASKQHFFLHPVVETGQQGFFAGGSQYSEGAVFVNSKQDGTGVDLGRGFLESTGYGNALNQTIRLAGLPQTEEMRKLLLPPPITQELKNKCTAFISKPENAAELLRELGLCKGL